MKYKCLLVDDEPPALKILESYIGQMDNLQVAGKCKNAFEAMSFLEQKQVDVLFLDIKMPRLSGTEFLRTLRNPPMVIFTTAFREFAIEGFALDAVDYLEKPFSFERFIKAVNKLNRWNDALPSPAPKYAPSSTKYTLPSSDDAFLYFRSDRKMVKVILDDILYIESLKDYVKIVRSNEKPLIIKKSISSLQEMLPETQFIRIHRSFIISIKRVTAFTQTDVQVNGLEIPVGKHYSPQLGRLSGER